MLKIDENRRAFINALKYGGFDQTTQAVIDDTGFNPVGVALMAINDPYVQRCLRYGLESNSKAAYNTFRGQFAVERKLLNTIIEMNDEELRTFEEIADYLVEAWGL